MRLLAFACVAVAAMLIYGASAAPMKDSTASVEALSSGSRSGSSANASCGTAYSISNNTLRMIRHPRNLPTAAKVNNRSVLDPLDGDGDQAQQCQPGSLQCLSDGWQECGASGKYQVR